MAHTYTVTSSTYIAGVPGPDPIVTVIGTVDGIDGSIQIWLSSIQQAQTQGGITAVKNLIAPLMLAQSIINNPPPPQAPTQLPTGTFTQ